MSDDPTEEQLRQVKQAIEAMSRATQEPTGEQERQAIEEAMERHWIPYEEAVKLIKGQLDCPEGRAIKKLKEVETSGEVRFYRPGPPDYVEDEKAAIYDEKDLRFWLTQISAPERIKPVTAAEPAKPLRPAKKRGRRDGYDWPDAIQFLSKLLDERGDPENPENRIDGWRGDSDIGLAVQAYILKHEDKEPDLSTVMRRIRPELERLRAKMA